MFIDRFLASTISYGIDTFILFNKIDNYDKKSKEIVKNLKKYIHRLVIKQFQFQERKKSILMNLKVL